MALAVVAMEVVPSGPREEAVGVRPTIPNPEPRMDSHENARTTRSRMLIVQRLAAGRSVSVVAAALGITPNTVRKWRDRHAANGVTGLADRSSRPRRSPTRLDTADEDAIVALRRHRLSSPGMPAGSAIPSPPSASCSDAAVSAAWPPRSPPACHTLRTRTPGRADPHRHQEARPHRRHRTPHHRQPHRAEQPPGCRTGPRLGIPPRRHR